MERPPYVRAREKFTNAAGNERSSRKTGWQRAKTRDGGERQGRRISDPGWIRATCTATPLASRLHLCGRFSLDSQRSCSFTNRAVGGHILSLYSASEYLRSIADNADSFTISAPHRATCWLCERGCGRILDRDACWTPDPFTAFPFWRKSEVQDTVCDASPTTTRSVLSNVLLRRSISCSVLGAFRAVKNQHAAPPTRPSLVRV
ncbi:hypothetical protein B0H14DRAFT_3545315 [Mycena olivaceomarginata]|nr:hypothetical protein B0H14DRAFT_3545315 [Mycena olivaceomarginata]